MFNNLRSWMLVGTATLLSACMGVDPGSSAEKGVKVSRESAMAPHRRHSYLVDQTKIRNVTVRMGSGFVPITIWYPEGPETTYWYDVLQQAIADWNAGEASSVNFVYTTGPADIEVENSPLGDWVSVWYNDYYSLDVGVATADLPSSGRMPGSHIRVVSELWSWNSQRMLHALSHGLGHAIGFEDTDGGMGDFIAGTNASDPSVMDGTPLYGGSQENPVSAADKLAATALYPNFERIGGAWWNQTIGITNWGGYVYIVHNSRLYKVDASTGSYTQLGGAVWNQAVAITSYGSYLYILHASKLYQVDPSTGSYTQLGGASWNQAVAMTTHGSNLYILHASKLYQVSPSTGAFTQIGGAWWSAASTITSLGSWLYLIHNGYLYEVNPSTGAYTQKGSSVYTVAPIKMTARGNYLYIVENSALNRTETSGAYLHGQDAIWSTTRGMTSIGDYVYILQDSYLVKVHKMEI